MKTRRRLTGIEVAEQTLRAELATGPKPTRAVRAAAGVEIPDETWRLARVRVGATAFRRDGGWWWALPSSTAALEDELAAWLATPHGRFAVYVAEHDRLAAAAPGTQLELA